MGSVVLFRPLDDSLGYHHEPGTRCYNPPGFDGCRPAVLTQPTQHGPKRAAGSERAASFQAVWPGWTRLLIWLGLPGLIWGALILAAYGLLNAMARV